MKHYRSFGKDFGRSIEDGSIKSIAESIGVSRQYAYRCMKENRVCKGYKIYYTHTTISRKHTTCVQKVREARHLLSRARIIIDEYNAVLVNGGKYSHIGIIDDIDRFLK